jgi:hypothetical protein
VPLLAGIVNGAVNHLHARAVGAEAIPLAWTIGRETLWWLTAAAFAPLLFAVSRRVPFGRGRLLRPLAAHAAAIAVLAFPATLVCTAAVRLLLPPGPATAPYWWEWVPALALEPTSYATVFAVGVIGWHAVEAARTASAAAAEGARLQAALARTRVEVLRTQTAPALVDGTMDAIAARMREGDAREARRLVTRLGDVLRLSLEEGRGASSLREEMAFVETWLDIRRVRAGDHVDVRVEVAAPAGRATLPALSLQPLVEAALRAAGGGAAAGLRISAGVAAGRVTVEVEARGAVAVAPPAALLDVTRHRLADELGGDARLDARTAAGGLRLRIDAPYRPAPGSAAGDDDEGSEGTA